MSQIALPLEQEPGCEKDGYLVTAANRAAHELLQNWTGWPRGTALLIGPRGSGKSAMSAAFERVSGGLVADDAEQLAEEDLFHLWNRAQESRQALLITSALPVAEWSLDLPDLQSRIAAAMLIEIGLPDEPMIEGLLQQYFTARGLSISDDALVYLVKRAERSYEYVRQLARTMDRLAIERKKPVTRAIAMAALEELSSGNENQAPTKSTGKDS